MSISGDVKMYARFALGLRRFLREKITLDQALATIGRHLADREANFLRVLERAVFGYRKSPYLPLFEIAGCEFGDVRNMLRDRGLEGTLLALRQAGICVSFEECKGREPIVRGGRTIWVTAHDFDNPFSTAHYDSESGGSTGAGTRVHHDLDYLAERAVHDLVAYTAYGIMEGPWGVWRGVLPDGSGFNSVLALARCGNPPLKWFTPATPLGWSRSDLKFRLANQTTVLLGRVLGVPLPWPERVPIEEAPQVARWAASMVRDHGKCAMSMVASRALRVSLAALKEGIELTGVTFVIAGEPVTPAKVRGILNSGARYVTTYGFSEAGRIGRGCCHPASSNDLHLLTDMCAVVSYPRLVSGPEINVPAFNVTCLLPSSPKILINAESDDYGILETRSCGCPLEDAGFTIHVREIRSFRKLTGEGITLVASEALHVLEEVLPARFGGSALDYQFVEEEDEEGFTRVTLAISPEIPVADESGVITTVLEALGKGSPGGDVAGQTWRQAGTLRIKRMEPVRTKRGKLLPLYLAKRRRSELQ